MKFLYKILPNLKDNGEVYSETAIFFPLDSRVKPLFQTSEQKHMNKQIKTSAEGMDHDVSY